MSSCFEIPLINSILMNMVKSIDRRLGVHVSIAGGVHLAPERARALGCTAMQIFSHNPRGWAARPIPGDEASAFKALRAEYGISPVFVHCSYLINVASKDEVLREKSISLLKLELQRADAIGAEFVVLHPGSSSGDEDAGRARAIESIARALAGEGFEASLLIENTSGKRGDITPRIKDLAEIREGLIGRGFQIGGVCIDTCHAFAAGYDISGKNGVESLAVEITRMLPEGFVKLIHLNDSKGACGSGLDRHEHIGMGNIGINGLRALLRHFAFAFAPVILETPKETDGDDPRNLAAARSLL